MKVVAVIVAGCSRELFGSVSELFGLVLFGGVVVAVVMVGGVVAVGSGNEILDIFGIV